MSLGDNIRNKRQELKLSQEYVADMLGVSRQAVSKWETGQSEPTASNLIALADIFQTSLSELVDSQKNSSAQDTDIKQDSKKQSDFILHTNLSLIAISMQAGALYSCTQISYSIVGAEKIPDYRFSLFKIAFLFFCSVWMSRNLFYEEDPDQRKKNSRIELLYCIVQAIIALCTYHFNLGIIGLVLLSGVLFFYVLYINPKYMNRPFGKKQY
ncbi:MAG: helix-turn-helix transcriptional regulator [Anaerofustis stercorihominis]|nr:helix-turn-helix transcriptional regulator [Anaerofustis stercorihominis]